MSSDCLNSRQCQGTFEANIDTKVSEGARKSIFKSYGELSVSILFFRSKEAGLAWKLGATINTYRIEGIPTFEMTV